MKIIIETKEDKVVILAAMDCVAKHMGYRGLPILNTMNVACEGLDCISNPVTVQAMTAKAMTKARTKVKAKN